ncbi:hypothetical protein CQW23_01334 [Capsicum baccatum]|uniref:NAC domain-containing protein n=1 Tax=Capsicum baccatum TaxID=33114 RepID=A0A2G2XNN8_CAPBA|nr:hypothetical protein CQW23_01334 [Capsicum baccatum]
MGNNFDDEQLMAYLLKFVCGKPIQCQQIQVVDLYGNNKPSQLFNTTITSVNYVFTKLKKKTRNGKNINRGIVGGDGSWKGINNSKPVYNREMSVIGFQKTFRFDEGIHVWNMKEYRLTDETIAVLRKRCQILHEDFVVCRITYHVPKPKQLTAKSSAQYQFQENQELGGSNAATVVPYDQFSSIWNGNEYSITQETPHVSSNDDIARYHRELDAYAASILESVSPIDHIAHRELDAYAATTLEFDMNSSLDPYVPQDEDYCSLFCEDFYIGHTDLWS